MTADLILIKRGNMDLDSRTTSSHIQMKTEIGVMYLSTKECQRLPANHGALERKARRDHPSMPEKEPSLPTP